MTEPQRWTWIWFTKDSATIAAWVASIAAILALAAAIWSVWIAVTSLKANVEPSVDFHADQNTKDVVITNGSNDAIEDLRCFTTLYTFAGFISPDPMRGRYSLNRPIKIVQSLGKSKTLRLSFRELSLQSIVQDPAPNHIFALTVAYRRAADKRLFTAVYIYSCAPIENSNDLIFIPMNESSEGGQYGTKMLGIYKSIVESERFYYGSGD